MSDYTWTTPEGSEVQIRAEGSIAAEFEYADGSRLAVEQDAEGNRVLRVEPQGGSTA